MKGAQSAPQFVTSCSSKGCCSTHNVYFRSQIGVNGKKAGSKLYGLQERTQAAKAMLRFSPVLVSLHSEQTGAVCRKPGTITCSSNTLYSETKIAILYPLHSRHVAEQKLEVYGSRATVKWIYSPVWGFLRVCTQSYQQSIALHAKRYLNQKIQERRNQPYYLLSADMKHPVASKGLLCWTLLLYTQQLRHYAGITTMKTKNFWMHLKQAYFNYCNLGTCSCLAASGRKSIFVQLFTLLERTQVEVSFFPSCTVSITPRSQYKRSCSQLCIILKALFS